jgi:hypothetical protein
MELMVLDERTGMQGLAVTIHRLRGTGGLLFETTTSPRLRAGTFSCVRLAASCRARRRDKGSDLAGQQCMQSSAEPSIEVQQPAIPIT